jgi:hypothetical protein
MSARTLRLSAGLLLLAAGNLGAQAFDVPRHAIAAGGGRSTGGGFTLTGTVGQAEAATAPATGGAFRLRGGWLGAPAAPRPEAVFASGFEDP